MTWWGQFISTREEAKVSPYSSLRVTCLLLFLRCSRLFEWLETSETGLSPQTGKGETLDLENHMVVKFLRRHPSKQGHCRMRKESFHTERHTQIGHLMCMDRCRRGRISVSAASPFINTLYRNKLHPPASPLCSTDLSTGRRATIFAPTCRIHC